MATLSLPSQGEVHRHGRGRPPGPKKLAMMAQEAPKPRILRAQEQLNKRAEILEQIKGDQWVERMIDVPINSLAIDVVHGRGYETVKLPPQHVDKVARSVAIDHFTPLVNLQREKHQLCLIETGFSIYFQFGQKYMTDERCEWLIFKSKWKGSIEKFDRAFEKKEATKEKYCDGVIKSYQQLVRFLKTYRNKLLEERVNLEYKKWLASAKLTLSLEEEEIPKDYLDRERVYVLHGEDAWSFGLPETSASHAIQKYMEKWPTSETKQVGEHYSITSDWMRTTCQNSLKIFGRNPPLRGQEAPAGPERDNGASGDEEESLLPPQVAGNGQDVQKVPRKLEGTDIFANFEWQTFEEMVENHDATTTKLDEQAISPLQAKGSSEPSHQGEVTDGAEVSASRQTQDSSTAARAAEDGQAMKKSSSSPPLMIPHREKSDGDGEKTPPNMNGSPKNGHYAEKSYSESTDEESPPSIYPKGPCPHAELASTPQAVLNAERTPTQALPGPSVQRGNVQETTLGSVSVSPEAPRAAAGPSMNDSIRDAAPGDSSQQLGTVSGMQASRPAHGQRPRSMNALQTSFLDVPRSSTGTSHDARSEPMRGFFSNDPAPEEMNTQQSSTSTSGGLRAPKPPMGKRPENMNAWQANLQGGLEGAAQRTMQRLRSREASRASQTPAPLSFTPINPAQAGLVQSNQGLSAANGPVAQGQPLIVGSNGNLREATPLQRGMKRPANSQGDARPAQRPRGPDRSTPWTEPYRMSQYRHDPVQAPVSGIPGGRTSRGIPDLTHDAYAREWADLYKQNNLRGQLGNMNAVGRSATPIPVAGYGSNSGTPNGQSNYFAIPRPPMNSHDTMGVSPLPSHQINQMGNFQNDYSSNNYSASHTQYPSINNFATPSPGPPQMNQQSYMNNHQMFQQPSEFDPVNQARFPLGHAQHGVLIPNMIPQSIPSIMPHPMQQSAYGPAMTSSGYNSGHPPNARGSSQTPQLNNWPQPQNIAPSQAGGPSFQGVPGMSNGSQGPSQTTQHNHWPQPRNPAPIQTGSPNQGTSEMSTQPMMINQEPMRQAHIVPLEPALIGVPSQEMNPATLQAGRPSIEGSPGVSNQSLMMKQEPTRQAQSVPIAASPDSVSSQGMSQASHQNSSRSPSESQSNSSASRRSTGSSGEHSEDTRPTTESSTSSNTPRNDNLGMHGQVST